MFVEAIQGQGQSQCSHLNRNVNMTGKNNTLSGNKQRHLATNEYGHKERNPQPVGRLSEEGRAAVPVHYHVSTVTCAHFLQRIGGLVVLGRALRETNAAPRDQRSLTEMLSWLRLLKR